MTTADPNADLIGYEFTMAGDPPVTFRVTGSDTTCGPNYVACSKSTEPGRKHIRPASVIRRAKMIESQP